jgi:hypothetical protein
VATAHVRKWLRRYTNLPFLIYLLVEKKITLLNPQKWDDRNDSYYLSLYRDSKKLKTVLALCFTQASETYHHWRVFSDGSSGACVEFNRKELVKAVSHFGIQAGEVTYSTREKLRSRKTRIEELPFLKRQAFRDDHEFRFIYGCRDEERETLDLPIPLSCINRVTLSPWLCKEASDRIKDLLRLIEGCRDLSIARSTLINNEEWKRLGDKTISRNHSISRSGRQ